MLQSGGGKTSGPKTGHDSREGVFYDSFLGDLETRRKDGQNNVHETRLF